MLVAIGVVVGKTGSGKSTTVTKLGEVLYNHGYKVFDLSDTAGRLEPAYWSLPSNSSYWRYPKIDPITKKVFTKTSYPTKLLFPASKILPHNLPDISQIFTIPITSLTFEDLQILFAIDIPVNVRNIFYTTLSQCDNDTSIADFINLMNSTTKKSHLTHSSGLKLEAPNRRGLSELMLNFFSFIDNGTLTSKRNPLAINLEKEIKDNKTITALCLRYYPTEFRLFIINYFIKNIYEILVTNKSSQKVVIIIKELADVVPKDPFSESQRVIKHSIEGMFRKARGVGMSFIVDSQSISEISNIMKGQATYLIVHNCNSIQDIENLAMPMVKEHLTRQDISAIGKLQRGEAYVFTPKMAVSTYIIPPRCIGGFKEGSDFFKEYKANLGNFKDFSKELELIETELKESIKEQNIKFEKELEESHEEKKFSYQKFIPIELLKLKQFTINDAMSVLKLNQSSTWRYIQAWEKEGLLKRTQEGRSVKYSIENL